MSDVTAPPSPIDAAPAAPWPFPRRFLAVLTRPIPLFEYLAQRPSWLVPFILLVLAAAAFVVGTWNAAWLPTILEKMGEQNGGEQAMEMIQNNGLMMYSIMIPLFGAAVTLIYAAAVMLIGGFLLSGRLTFRQCLSIVCHAGLVSLVALPIRILLANAAQSPQVTLGPGALLPPDQQEGFVMKFLAFFLQSFDVFTLWQTALVALGVSVIGRVGLKPAMIAMFGLFLVFSVLGALVGALTGG
jgi:Yip1-like protein